MALVLDGNGTMTVGNGDITGITAGAIESAAIGTGAVLQVVQGTPMSSEFSTTSTTYVDVTGLTATITPKFSTSKILVFVFMSDIISAGTSYDTALRIKLLRGSTNLVEQTNQLFGFNASGGRVGNSNIVFLDSPSTTSSTTYKMQLHSRTGSSVSINAYYTLAKSNIFLMEIAG